MDGEGWWATVHGVAKSRTQLSDFTTSPVVGGGYVHICLSHLKSTFSSRLSKSNFPCLGQLDTKVNLNICFSLFIKKRSPEKYGLFWEFLFFS